MPHGDDGFRMFPTRRVSLGAAEEGDDRVAVEEPMEIRVVHGAGRERTSTSLSITMRTPGHDFELAVGFLFTERILTRPDQVRAVEFCGPPAPGRATSNIVRVELDPEIRLDVDRLERHFFASSSCGICGKASLEALELEDVTPPEPDRPRIRGETIHQLPDTLRSLQPLFSQTGGVHAAALAAADGAPGDAREDVGRHNAVDKLLGRQFLDGRTPLADGVLVVSGRASFEILQKGLAGGVPVVVAVGAPSSLAVDVAERFGVTLIGFASRERYNVYAGFRRML